MIHSLRPYQQQVASAVLDSAMNGRGLNFTVEIARQGGKNELSSRIEIALLMLNSGASRNLVKCSPSFKPQTIISMTRLKDRLDDAGLTGSWVTEHGYIIRLGAARAVFLSADDSSRVVGHTAHLLLEIDEAQDVSKEKFSKEFKPMGSTTNVTTVLYGTAWDDSTLLEEGKQTNLELEKKDGIRRHFGFDWQEVARHNPDYLKYVEGERDRLGENHPLFRTQYCLLPVRGGGGFFSAQQRAQLQGAHSRLHRPLPGRVYVAGIDLAGEAEGEEDEYLRSLAPRRDSTVVTIAEINLSEDGLSAVPLNSSVRTAWEGFPGFPHRCEGACSVGLPLSAAERGSFGFPPAADRVPLDSLSPAWERVRVRGSINIVEHYSFTGVRHAELYPRLVDLLKSIWHCRRVVVDATGVGQPVYSFLREALGGVVSPFVFTAPSKSELGFNLLAAVNSGRLKMYAGDGSAEYQTFWSQIEKAKSYYRASRTMNFYVDPSHGHDDFLMSLALVVEAGSLYEPRTARGR